ncbi:hypothetical protein QTG54_007834 [Skeletonema marinoi]|uniref:PSI domain-containing protein n=1 Tax=Skeletonema marinoi TaxID=267567 RepID=A0AAD9DBF5_9STRA|nr:hypothetical protein QTG54_007834 [Skeletonema marinoi]
MQLITLSFLLIAVAQAQASAASTSTYSASIFSAAVATSSVALVNAKNVDNGICTGGTTYCSAFTSNHCPLTYCNTNPYPYDNDSDTCQAAYGQTGEIPCAMLPEWQCKETSGFSACKFVPINSNQKAINAVLVAFVTISLVVLLVILIVVCRLLPKKETALTQPLLDEENS